MIKPSLSTYFPKSAPEPTPQPVDTLKKTDMKHITVRMLPNRHRRILELTMHLEIKIQAYITDLIVADFDKRGLPSE